MPADMSVTQQFHTSAVVDVYPGMLVWEAGVTRVATADDCQMLLSKPGRVAYACAGYVEQRT